MSKHPSGKDVIAVLKGIISAFESSIEAEVFRVRWDEIKKIQRGPLSYS
jgi:hypothetical protein